jgi:hypothetical protein
MYHQTASKREKEEEEEEEDFIALRVSERSFARSPFLLSRSFERDTEREREITVCHFIKTNTCPKDTRMTGHKIMQNIGEKDDVCAYFYAFISFVAFCFFTCHSVATAVAPVLAVSTSTTPESSGG